MFDNSDFGYYKVTIERPKRLKAQFSAERIETLRWDKTLREPMQWAYAEWGEEVYTDIDKHAKELLDWCEKNELNLNSKQSKALVGEATWQKGKELMRTANTLMEAMGGEEYNDFNLFLKEADAQLKAAGIKLTASERNAILNAVSWYDAEAEKVVKGTVKLNEEKLDALLERLNCPEDSLPHYGYYPTGKKGEYIEYETEGDLRDTENVPLKENIYRYFLREVQPHVEEAWINLEATKIGYEVSFNKYFYRHKPLRELDVVTAEILQLEEESEGLIRDILNLV